MPKNDEKPNSNVSTEKTYNLLVHHSTSSPPEKRSRKLFDDDDEEEDSPSIKVTPNHHSHSQEHQSPSNESINHQAANNHSTTNQPIKNQSTKLQNGGMHLPEIDLLPGETIYNCFSSQIDMMQIKNAEPSDGKIYTTNYKVIQLFIYHL